MVSHLFDAVIVGIGHHNASPGAGRDIHVVHTDAATDNGLGFLEGLDDTCGDWRVGDENHVRIAAYGDDLFLGGGLTYY